MSKIDPDNVMSREQLLRLGLQQASGCIADILGSWQAKFIQVEKAARRATRVPPPIPILTKRWVRPPGALSESAFLAACTRCDDCVKACPHFVIRKAGPELGATVTGSPVIIPGENACLMCTEMPCSSACETGALLLSPGISPKIGDVVVDAAACYQAQGQPCDYCQTTCPVRPRAITVGSPGKQPDIRNDLCTGCGKCAEICPADAIDIIDHRQSGGFAA